MVAFDVETTGVDVEADRIVTASTVGVRCGTDPVHRDWLADPGIEIPVEASDIHGITTEHARAHGKPAGDVVAEICGHLTQVWSQGYPVVIYNAPFDLTVLHREALRYGVPFEAAGPVVCPMLIDRHFDRYRPGSRKLVDVCRHYGVPLAEDDAHTSSADALATVRLMWKLARTTPAGSMTLDELQEAQQGWHRESQLSFAAYLDGKTAHRVLDDAVMLSGAARAAKLADLAGLLDRADRVRAEAEWWPLRPVVTR